MTNSFRNPDFEAMPRPFNCVRMNTRTRVDKMARVVDGSMFQMGCTEDGFVCLPQVQVDYRARSNPTTDHFDERSRVTLLYHLSKHSALSGLLYATNHPNPPRDVLWYLRFPNLDSSISTIMFSPPIRPSFPLLRRPPAVETAP